MFFRLLAPVALYVNERILEDRSRAQALLASQAAGRTLTAEDREWLADLGRVYKLGPIDDSKLVDMDIVQLVLVN